MLRSSEDLKSSPHTRGWSRFRRPAGITQHVFPAYAGVVLHQWKMFRNRVGLPRIRGGGRAAGRSTIRPKRSSPHTRGWSVHPRSDVFAGPVFPAYAGVVPWPLRLSGRKYCLPRIRGGGPSSRLGGPPPGSSSPHTRGWSLPTLAPSLMPPVFPAYAGVVPGGQGPRPRMNGLPRIRGGGPFAQKPPAVPRTSSPHTRGGPSWKIMYATGLKSSPHTRGWPPGRDTGCAGPLVFPAYAGVVPPASPRPASHQCLPRIRGGGPGWAGVEDPGPWSSPHTRGWSVSIGGTDTSDPVFPAYAGVVPHHPTPPDAPPGLPRIRGGWSPSNRTGPIPSAVFPAYAGVVRRRR